MMLWSDMLMHILMKFIICYKSNKRAAAQYLLLTNYSYCMNLIKYYMYFYIQMVWEYYWSSY